MTSMAKDMKDSGIEWIGEIPKEWDIRKIDSCYNLRNTKVSDRDFQPLSVTKKGIVPQLETAAKTDAHDDRKLVRVNDFVINSRSDRRGSCGISDYEGSVSLINTVLECKFNSCSRFYNWLFHTVQFSDEFYKWGHGIVDDLWTTNWKDMRNISIPYPPLSTQTRIADFLDQKCSQIDTLVSNIESQILKLDEYKKALITHAVTKGLDPDIEMKDSGIEWIGKIPKGWEISKIGALGKLQNGISKDGSYFGHGYPFTPYGDVYINRVLPYPTGLIETTKSERQRYSIEEGDVFFTRTSEVVDEVGIASTCFTTYPNASFAGFLIRFRPNSDKLNRVFSSYYFRSGINQNYLAKEMMLVTRASLSQNLLKKMPVLLPPLSEQIEISEYLNEETRKILDLKNNLQKQLEFLSNYKKSLIFDYVTGKKEVPTDFRKEIQHGE